MPSERQLKANRKNAALGGPKTESGRAAVRFNAVTHGLAAVAAVLPGEDGGAFQQLREELLREYEPAGPTEILLFEEFVRCSWRLLRLRRVETEMWTGYIITLRTRDGADRNVNQQEGDRALAATLAETPQQHLANYFRYERAITRDIYRALDKLEAIQRQRAKCVPDPAPASGAVRDPRPPAPEPSGNGIRTVPRPSPATSPSTQKPPAPGSDPTDIDSRRCA